MRIRRQSSRSSGAGIVALAVFGAFWSALTLAFDVMMVRGLVHQIDASRRFVPVIGTISRSKVETHTDSDGTSYRARVEYAYRVGGRDYRADRIAFGPNIATSRQARQDVARFAAGTEPTVYVDPDDPSRAVLDPRVRGIHVFALVFMSPFNAVMLCLWLGVAHAWRERGRPAGASRHVAWDDGRTAHLRLPSAHPAIVGIGASGAIGFVLAIGVGLATGFTLGVPAATAALGVTILGGIAAGLHASNRRRAGAFDVVVDRTLRRLRLPPRSALLLGMDAVAFDQIESVDVERRAPDDPEASVRHVLRVRLRSRPEPIGLATLGDAEQAASLAAWLNEQLGPRRAA